MKTDPFDDLLKAAGFPPAKKPPALDEEDDAAPPESAPAGNASVPDDDGSAAHAPGADAANGGEDAPEEDGDHDDDGLPDAEDPDADGDDVPDAEDEDYGAGTGDVQGLYAEVAEAEKAYYAARGFHGAGHHKAEAALDAFHRVVRKMVRAITGATGEAPEGGDPTADPNADPNADPGDEDPNAQQQDGDAEGDGDGVPDEGVDEEGAQDDDPGNGPPQTATQPPSGMAVGAPHAGAGKPKQVATPQGAAPGKGPPGKPGGGPPGAAKKKPKPFGKSDMHALRKGLYAYAGGDASAVPDKFLHEYLCGFIEEAYEAQSRESTHARMARNVDYMAARVLTQLVQYIPKNANLARAATQFAVTADVVATILRAKRIIAAPDMEGLGNDSDAHTAMGHYDIPRSVDPMLRSMSPALAAQASVRPWFSGDPLAKGAEGVRRAAKPARPDGNALVIDDTADPAARLAKSQHQRARALWDLKDGHVVANVDQDCIIHGNRDLTKSQNLRNAYVVCSCPRC
ncbi:MAG: hypothetical protein M3Q55_06640 [Acidobacteriota bacterium]|nr:hypothetical protein [Acidobacteriota bacterium]